MRKIRFRGQTVDTKELIYGDLIHRPTVNDICIANQNLTRSVSPDTVGQFTSFTDKNGVEIYENDIIKVDLFSKPYFISFGQSEKWGACFCVQSHNSITFLTKNWASTSEVIGNIHENPEMIHGIPELL